MVTFENKTTGDGLVSSVVYGVHVLGNNVYAATNDGLSISTDGGSSFTNKTTANSSLGNNLVNNVYVTSDGIIFAGTEGGLTIFPFADASLGANYTTGAGLGSNSVYDVYASGNNIYVATSGGLSISTNSGTSWTNTNFNNAVRGVYVSEDGDNIFAATDGGLRISSDSGANFTNKTTADGLGSDGVSNVFMTAANGTIYAATGDGVSISTNGGISFTNKKNGLVPDPGAGNTVDVLDIYVDNSGTIYAATSMGLGISADGGDNFANITTTNGLGNNIVNSVYVIGSNIYVGTYGGLGIYIAQSNNQVICFPINTPITTDQGIVAIQDLEKDSYTINGNKVLGVVSHKPKSSIDMVLFKQHALGYNMPSKDTLMTRNHQVYYNNVPREAIAYTTNAFKLNKTTLKGLPNNPKPQLTRYNKEVYNVILEDGHIMKVNNLLVETLHPSNKLYKQKLLK